MEKLSRNVCILCDWDWKHFPKEPLKRIMNVEVSQKLHQGKTRGGKTRKVKNEGPSFRNLRKRCHVSNCVHCTESTVLYMNKILQSSRNIAPKRPTSSSAAPTYSPAKHFTIGYAVGFGKDRFCRDWCTAGGTVRPACDWWASGKCRMWLVKSAARCVLGGACELALRGWNPASERARCQSASLSLI